MGAIERAKQLKAANQEVDLINRFLNAYSKGQVIAKWDSYRLTWALTHEHGSFIFTNKDFDLFLAMITGYRVGLRSGFFLPRRVK